MPDQRPGMPRVVFTCEHAGNRVPGECEGLIPASALTTHCALDAGTLALTHALGAAFEGAPAHIHLITRLVVDTNRSINNDDLFSPYTRHLPPRIRKQLLSRYYTPFRRAVLSDIRKLLRTSSRTGIVPAVVHVSVHSFTPVLRGARRSVDVGILFDPARGPEAALSDRWIEALRMREKRLRITANEPYLGTSDGHTTALRKVFKSAEYAGIEIELNQRFVRNATKAHVGAARLARLHASIVLSLAEVLAGFEPAKKLKKTRKNANLSTNRQKTPEKQERQVESRRKQQ